MNFLYPVPANSIVSQSYTEHVQRAKNNGWCYKPGNCPGGVWYYGGIDFAIPTGTPVHAAADGVVLKAGWDTPGNTKAGYGMRIYIQHADGYLTIYGHLNFVNVKVGDSVKAGQEIGVSDNTGNSTGPHLHFELRHNGIPEDPASYLTGQVQPPEPEPTPTPQSLPTFPQLVQVQLTTTVRLSIHQEAAINSPVSGYVSPGYGPLDVLRVIQDGDNLIAQIGYRQFVYLRYKGDEWYQWLPYTF